VESGIREEQILNQVIGHILFSPVTVHSNSDISGAMALGPLAVLPKYQGQGIGSQLVEAGLEACRQAGQGVVFVLGHPGYYSRFGFEAARPLGLDWEHDAPAGAFMVQELNAGVLAGRKGTVRYLPAFDAV
jgi:putative acetyltransferase